MTPETPANLNQNPDRLGQSIELDVQAIHEPLIRENNDPRDGFEPIPFWMAIIFAGLLFWGGLYVGSESGNFRFDIYDSPNPSSGVSSGSTKSDSIPTDEAGLIALGKNIYVNCAGCHQPSGTGGNGIPPLAGSDWVVGDNASSARLARILLSGLKDDLFVNGVKYNGQMPAWGSQLKDHQIAAVLTYIRNEWGNKAPAIFPADIAAAREKLAGRPVNGSQPYTQAELDAIPISYQDAAPPAKDDPKKDAPPMK